MSVDEPRTAVRQLGNGEFASLDRHGRRTPGLRRMIEGWRIEPSELRTFLGEQGLSLNAFAALAGKSRKVVAENCSRKGGRKLRHWEMEEIGRLFECAVYEESYCGIDAFTPKNMRWIREKYLESVRDEMRKERR